MNKRQLSAFRATMSQGSLTRASETMHLSQPAVTRLIATLEEDLGFRLFERTSGGVIPTPEATAFAAEVDRYFLGVGRLEQVAEEIRELRQGNVRVASMPALASDLLPDVIATFHKDHPAVHIALDVHTSSRIVELIATGAFDFGCVHLPVRRPDVEIVAGYEIACVIALAPSHPLAAKHVIRPADLKDVELVRLSHHTVTSHHIEHMFLSNDITPTGNLEAQPSYVACALVARSNAVTIVDPFTPSMFDEKIIVARPFLPELPFRFGVVRPAGAIQSRTARAAMNEVLARLDASPTIARLSSPGEDPGA